MLGGGCEFAPPVCVMILSKVPTNGRIAGMNGLIANKKASGCWPLVRSEKK